MSARLLVYKDARVLCHLPLHTSAASSQRVSLLRRRLSSFRRSSPVKWHLCASQSVMLVIIHFLYLCFVTLPIYSPGGAHGEGAAQAGAAHRDEGMPAARAGAA